MFAALEQRARGVAARQAEARLRAIEEEVRRGLPAGVTVAREEGRLILSGRGLRRRFVSEAMLRWLGRAG